MPDFYTQFSCVLDVHSAKNAKRALDIYRAYKAEIEGDFGPSIGFELAIDYGSDTALWIRSDDYGEPYQVSAFVLRCAKALKLKGRWGFTWSHSCSKPQLDAFDGGACLLDLTQRKTIRRIDCRSWLEGRLTRRRSASRAGARKRKSRVSAG
jgi:hypothetical protein